MSGFFMLRREVLEGALRRLSGQGFKILLDILASSPRPLRVSELPYEFRERQHGESKLDTRIAWEYMMLIADKLIGHIVPVRFALFALVGGLGLFIHMAVLWFALTIAGAVFDLAQASAAVAAMTSNFFLNNLFTYRDRRLHGVALLRWLFTFYAICPPARSRMSASPAASFPGTRSGGSPALRASSSDRSGTTQSLQSLRGNKNKNRK
jgi:dolichol-phosphate mannosyltransferase